ncbi:DUF3854 domain-containing protein [Chloroflexota bacterium]
MSTSINHPFSDEIHDLLQSHFEHLTSSAISIDVIMERGYRSVLGKKALIDTGFSKAQQRYIGILIPLHGVDGTIVGYQYRPDHPRIDARDRAIKYENPTGSSVRLDVPPRCHGQLGDPGISLWFTEGVKKVDALASQDVCAVGLTGVWGFKGKNPLGGTTLLADFDYITLKGRLVYLVFDSDSSSNPQVNQALIRLKEHLERKGATVKILQLPPGPSGEKTGVDDYLAQGHTLDDLIALEVTEQSRAKTAPEKESSSQYTVEDGRICWLKQTSNGPKEVPLCNFTAKVTEDLLKDNGIEATRTFKITGKLGSGADLSPIEVSSTTFNSLNWVTAEWGMKTVIAAGQSSKDRLREAIQLQSHAALQRMVYTHTGWREIDGEMAFLSGSGAMSASGVEVELEPPLQRYQLLEPSGDPTEAIKTSFNYLLVANPEVTFPLWTAMYLAPLSELIEPSFTLWLVGPSGAFKSTLTALALSHFGAFDMRHLPASWRDTHNQLEKLLFLCKDIPLVIDDWAPGQDSAKARELEVKAEYIIRAQGNRQGRGRMRSDTSSRPNYIPRGLLITSGEQLPSGHSHASRIFSVEIERSDVDLQFLTAQQELQYHYCVAMSHYILWLKHNWPDLKNNLYKRWRQYRDEAQVSENHPRLPEVIASMYTALELTMGFALEYRAITDSEASTYLKTGWDIFYKLASQQSGRVEDERPGKRFIEALRAMFDQGKAVSWNKDDDSPRTPIPGTTAVGWRDGSDYLLLNPPAAYGAVHEFCQRSGEPFTFKQEAVWKDLKRLGYTDCQDGRTKYRAVIYGNPKWIIKFKKVQGLS